MFELTKIDTTTLIKEIVIRCIDANIFGPILIGIFIGLVIVAIIYYEVFKVNKLTEFASLFATLGLSAFGAYFFKNNLIVVLILSAVSVVLILASIPLFLILCGKRLKREVCSEQKCIDDSKKMIEVEKEEFRIQKNAFETNKKEHELKLENCTATIITIPKNKILIVDSDMLEKIRLMITWMGEFQDEIDGINKNFMMKNDFKAYLEEIGLRIIEKFLKPGVAHVEVISREEENPRVSKKDIKLMLESAKIIVGSANDGYNLLKETSGDYCLIPIFNCEGNAGYYITIHVNSRVTYKNELYALSWMNLEKVLEKKIEDYYYKKEQINSLFDTLESILPTYSIEHRNLRDSLVKQFKEILDSKNTIKVMVDQLKFFAENGK